VTDVKLLARWDGWCDPCETERPLALTESGDHGLRAWLRGVGAEDRSLTLTCGVCGEWQSVPHEEDDLAWDLPTSSPLSALRPLGVRQVLVRAAAARPHPGPSVPAPRGDAANDPSDQALELLADGFDLVALAG
jgi:hypothetical protein